jgi:hypothetical protein
MPSVFDDLYIQLFGQACSKEGQAFERIVAAVSKLVFPQAGVVYDQRLRGQVSNSLYQIDVLLSEDGQRSFGEAKDYTVQDKKVGRGDLQKLAGALLEVDAERGVFYSATDYTSPAKKYAQGAEQFLSKPIDLLHVRPSVQTDEEGRIRTIVLNIHVSLPNLSGSTFNPIWSASAQKLLSDWLTSQGKESAEMGLAIDTLFDTHGHSKLTIAELTAQGFGDSYEIAQGCFVLAGHYLKFEGMLLELRGLEYRVPFIAETHVIEIESSGTPRILVKAEDGSIDKLITDEQLKKVKFDGNGEVIHL